MYDEIDLAYETNKKFWEGYTLGLTTGLGLMFAVCLGLGIYFQFNP